MFLIVPSPNPGASAVRTEVCPWQRPRRKNPPLSGRAGRCGGDLPSHRVPSPLPRPFVPSVALCPHPRDPSPPALLTTPDPLPQLEEWLAMKGTLERSVIPSFYPISSFFLQNRLLRATSCRVGLLKTTTTTKQPKPSCVSRQPSRPAQTENSIDKFGKGQTLTLMQAGTRGFFFIKSFTA